MIKLNRRDDFKVTTKRLLAQNVGNLCSNPDCRVLTLGAKTEVLGSAGVGVAAHITAAAIGGPRYDVRLTKDERKGYQNGIWLCQNCARIIDIDVLKYPIPLLELWKKKAEKFSNNNIGKQLYDEAAVRKEVLKNTVEYINDQSVSSSSKLVLEALKLNESNITELDPRFGIKTNIINGELSYILEPKCASIELQVAVKDKKDHLLINSFLKLAEEGREFSIDLNKINMCGSPLFEQLMTKPDAVFQVGAVKSKKKCHIYVTNKNKTVDYCLASCDALCYGGTKKSIIEGSALAKLLSFSVEYGFDVDIQLAFTIHTKIWIGKRIDKLPYFPKLLKVVNMLSDLGELRIVLDDPECDEVPIGVVSHQTANKSFIVKVTRLIKYIDKARIVNEYFGLGLTYEYFNVKEEESDALDELCDLIKSPVIKNREQLEKNPNVKVLLKDGFRVDDSPILATNTSVRFEAEGSLKQLFNQEIPTYIIRQEFTNITISTPDELSENTEVELELQMNKVSKYIKSLVDKFS